MPGRPFLQIPGPTLVPERIVRAMSQPIIDHRGPRFAALVEACLDGLKRVFQTRTGRIVLYPGSGTGAWEAAIVNRSEEHTSELQSLAYLVCRLLLEKKKNKQPVNMQRSQV